MCNFKTHASGCQLLLVDASGFQVLTARALGLQFVAIVINYAIGAFIK